MKKRSRARRDEDKQKRRDDILDAAEHAIARYGIEKMNFGHIAKKTKLSRPLIYVYFPTKEELVFAICERGLDELNRRFETVAKKHATGLERVLKMSEAYQAFSEQEPLYFKVISENETKPGKARHQSCRHESLTERAKVVLGQVGAAVTLGIQDGSLRGLSGDPGLTALSIWAFTHGLIQLSTSKREMLEEDFGVTSQRLFQHGLTVLREALATR